MTFSFLTFALLLLITASLVLLCVISFKNMYFRLCTVLFCIGFFVWSGIGICYEDVEDYYLIPYYIYLLVFILSFFFVTRKVRNNQLMVSKLQIPDKVINFLCFLFWVCVIINLFYPRNVIKNFFHPVFTLVGYFSGNEDTTLSYLIQTSIFMTRPFFYIKLYQFKRPVYVVFLVALEAYLFALINTYLSRSELVLKILFIMFILISKQDKFFKNKRRAVFSDYIKALVFITMLVVISLPFLALYTYIRSGVGIGSSFGLESLSAEVISIETSFPSLYDKALSFNSRQYIPGQYLIYLLTLPFPKRLFGLSSSFVLNYQFSEFSLGMNIEDSYFYVVLPGILGEGFIVGGILLFPLHAMLIGSVLGIFVKMFSKYEDMTIWLLFVILNIFISNRGGTQGCVSTIINGSILLLVLLIVSSKKRGKVG